jgi:hypothetical protein
MPWETDTVTGHLELMTAVRDFLTTNTDLVSAGQEWTVLKEETIAAASMVSDSGPNYPSGGYGANFRDIYLQAPGLAGTDEIYINLRSYEVPALGTYNWMMASAIAFDTLAKWTQQPGSSKDPSSNYYWPTMLLTNSTITYWIVASGRRFILVCKIGGDFLIAYCGFFLPYALPSEYPYPVICAGMTADHVALFSSTTHIGNFYCWKNSSSYTGGFLRKPDGIYGKIDCSSYNPATHIALFPWCLDGPSLYWNITGNLDGSVPLMPAVLYTFANNLSVFGELDGVYYLPGKHTVVLPLAEDIVQIGGVNYLIIQNIASANSWELAAIRLE